MLIDETSLARAKEYANEFTDNFIYHGGIVIGGHYFIPICKKCGSQHMAKLKYGCRIKDRTYSYSCKGCGKPAEVTAKQIR
jgi:RNase P subunit RPR2